MGLIPFVQVYSCIPTITNYFHPPFLTYLAPATSFIIIILETLTHIIRSHACRTNIKQFTMLSRGPKLWNSLPDTVKNAGTLNCFRNRIRKYLLQC